MRLVDVVEVAPTLLSEKTFVRIYLCLLYRAREQIVLENDAYREQIEEKNPKIMPTQKIKS